MAPGRRGLGRGDGVVDDEVLKGAGKGRVVPGPGHLGHGHPTGGAVHSRGGGHQRRGIEADVDMTPGPRTAAVVLPGAALPATPTAALRAHLLADPNPQLGPSGLGSSLCSQLMNTTDLPRASRDLSSLGKRTPSSSSIFSLR